MDRLLIAGEDLDFSGEYNISLEANNFLDFKPGTAFKSERLTIFNTPKNMRLLSNIFHINSDTVPTFTAYYISPVVQMVGVLQILKVDNQKAEAVFISGNGTLWDDLKGVKLNEIDCSEYNHTLNYTSVVASETYSESNFYIYDFCNRGTTIETDGVGINERFPAISIRNLLTKIFDGYTLTGDLINETWFKRLFLMFTQPFEIRNSEAWKTTALVSVGKTATQKLELTVSGGDPATLKLNETQVTFVETSPFFDKGSNFASNTYTIPETGTYRFKINFNSVVVIAQIGGTREGTITFRVKRNATLIVTKSMFIDDVSSNYFEELLDTGFMEFTAGDTVKAYVLFSGYSSGSAGVTDAHLNMLVGTTLINSVSRWYGNGSTVDMANILPDIDTLQFLQDLFLYFGLFPCYNVEERTIYFYQLKSGATGLDISEMIDQDAGVEFEIPEPVNYYLKFNSDSADKKMQFAIDNKQMSDGNYEYNIGEKETKDIKLRLFCNTFFDYATMGGDETTDKLPILWSDLTGTKFSTKFGLRILYYEGTESFTYNLNHGILDTGVIFHKRTVIPIFSNNTTVNLLFSGTDGMYQYHSRILQMVTSGKVAQCTAILNSDVISNFITGEYFRTPVFIQNKYISGRFMVLKVKQRSGNIFELTLLQKFD